MSKTIVKNTPSGKYELHCPICAASLIPDLPISLTDFATMTAKFAKEHHHGDACAWHYRDDMWTADCGLLWQISNDDTLAENNMNYCPKCGRPLIEVKPS